MKTVDVAINIALRTISGCLKPSPVLQLIVLAGIVPAVLRRKAATLALAWKAVKHEWHILHDTTKNEVPPCRLKSRNPTTRRVSRCYSYLRTGRRIHGLRRHGSRSGKHPDPPGYTATYRTQDKASRENI